MLHPLVHDVYNMSVHAFANMVMVHIMCITIALCSGSTVLFNLNIWTERN